MNMAGIFEILKRSIKEIMVDIDVDSLKMEDSIKALGANSIDRMEIIVMAMEEMGVKIPMLEFARAKNIGEIIGVLAVGKSV